MSCSDAAIRIGGLGFEALPALLQLHLAQLALADVADDRNLAAIGQGGRPIFDPDIGLLLAFEMKGLPAADRIFFAPDRLVHRAGPEIAAFGKVAAQQPGGVFGAQDQLRIDPHDVEIMPVPGDQLEIAVEHADAVR